MISGIVLIFAIPMILAAVLISPSGLQNLIHGVPLYAALGLLLPIVGWRTFLIEFVFPTAAATRVTAVIRLWVVGSVRVAAVINLLIAVLDYSPMRPGFNPTAGFCWLDWSFVCSSRVVFGGLSHRSSRATLQFAERW
jgi:hypothetical protein